MAVALSAPLRAAWESGQFIGPNRPVERVTIQRGYFQKGDGNHADNPYGFDWTQWWVPVGEWIELGGVLRTTIEQSLDQNGCAALTVDLANIAYLEETGAGGAYHVIRPGWMSPYRAYANDREPIDDTPNEWHLVFSEAIRVRVEQGYGDELLPQFDGVIDSADGRSDGTLKLVGRDHFHHLLDSHVFGWNSNPDKVPTFVAEEWIEAREDSSDEDVQEVAEKARERWMLCDDLSDAVRFVMEWAGLRKGGIRNTGIHKWKEPVKFTRGEYLIDIVKRAQNATGFVFFMGLPRALGHTYELGRPTFRRSRSYVVPEEVFEVKDTDLLTDVDWRHTYEMLGSVIRVRGKEVPPADGGVGLGTDRTPRVMGTYRPPWHTDERNARKVRHVIRSEPVLKTVDECTLMAMLHALGAALAGNTGTVEIPAYPGLELDDIIAVVDTDTGLSTRCWVAAKQQTFVAGEEVEYKQSLGVALLDTPDVSEVVDDIAALLDSIPIVIDTDPQPIT